MTVTTNPPDVEVSAAPRRSTKRRVLVGLGLGAVLACALTYAQRYDPLAPGHLTNSGDATYVIGVGSNRDVFELPFSPGRSTTVQFTIRNTGRWGITVDGVPSEPDDMFFRIAGAQAREMHRGGELMGPVALPYHLSPGQELAFEVDYLLRDCEVGGGQHPWYDSLPVRWHAFGLSHETEVQVPIVALRTPERVPPQYRVDCPLPPLQLPEGPS